MKTWEMIKALSEDPTKKYKLISDKLSVTALVDSFGYVIFSKETDKSIRPTHIKINDEWVEIIEPVTFLEALEAAKEGKRIRVDHPQLAFGFQYLNNLMLVLANLHSDEVIADVLLEGEWYIEKKKAQK